MFFLTLLTVAKRRSLFDDKSVEIQELTYIIKQDINSLNKQIGQLQQVSMDHTKVGATIPCAANGWKVRAVGRVRVEV